MAVFGNFPPIPPLEAHVPHKIICWGNFLSLLRSFHLKILKTMKDIGILVLFKSFFGDFPLILLENALVHQKIICSGNFLSLLWSFQLKTFKTTKEIGILVYLYSIFGDFPPILKSKLCKIYSIILNEQMLGFAKVSHKNTEDICALMICQWFLRPVGGGLPLFWPP